MADERRGGIEFSNSICRRLLLLLLLTQRVPATDRCGPHPVRTHCNGRRASVLGCGSCEGDQCDSASDTSSIIDGRPGWIGPHQQLILYVKISATDVLLSVQRLYPATLYVLCALFYS